MPEVSLLRRSLRSMGPAVWEGLAAQLTHLRLPQCPGAFTCGLLPELAAGKLASLDVLITELHSEHGPEDLAHCCMAVAGVTSLKAVSLHLQNIEDEVDSIGKA